MVIIFVIFTLSFSTVEAKEFKAKLTWYNLTSLSFRVNGIVSSIKVKPGDIVTEKQQMIELDQREYVENVSLTKALRKSRKSEFDEAKRELDRALELYDRTVLSEHELQVAKNNHISSETNYFTANTNWLKAKRDLEFSSIFAPFNSIVLSVAVNEHETIISSFESKPAVIIADSGKISAQFMLGLADINNINNESSVEVIIDGISYEGKLFFPSLMPELDLYPAAAVISLSNNVLGKKIRSGMGAIVRIK